MLYVGSTCPESTHTRLALIILLRLSLGRLRRAKSADYPYRLTASSVNQREPETEGLLKARDVPSNRSV